MRKCASALSVTLAFCLLTLPISVAAKKKTASNTDTGPAVIWRDAADIASRKFFYGVGAKDREPQPPFSFLKEDLDGTNPKFVVRDAQGIKWKVKLGPETRPETAATRLVWGAGYYTTEDYFLPVIEVQNMPPHLHRGQKLIDANGSIRNVRLKRVPAKDEKLGTWSWRNNPFTGTRELNGLRVLMSLINNWDLTDENNAIFRGNAEDGSPQRIYMVSDLGSSFGTPGLTWPTGKARGNLAAFQHSEFISNATPDDVDFRAPKLDSLFFLATPREYMQKVHLNWIGKHIPRADARWIGDVLAQISTDQIRDAFRAAGYSDSEVDGFTAAVQDRIAKLRSL